MGGPEGEGLQVEQTSLGAFQQKDTAVIVQYYKGTTINHFSLAMRKLLDLEFDSVSLLYRTSKEDF